MLTFPIAHGFESVWSLDVRTIYVWHQVLLDVTGATNPTTCEAKAEEIAKNAVAVEDAMRRTKFKLTVKSVVGILLAPNCDSPIEDAPQAEVVQGGDARDLLGGLQQLLTWLGDVSQGPPGQGWVGALPPFPKNLMLKDFNFPVG